MATQFIDKKSATTEITDKPNAAGIGVVSGELHMHNGSAVKKIARDGGSVDALTIKDLAIAASGSFDASELPTADPGVAGQVWSNAGVLTVSAG